MRLAAAACLLVACAWLAGAQASPPPVPAFDHVVVVVLENKDQGALLGSPDAPTFNSLARRYAVLSNYRGVTHPSLPNYLALVSGSAHGIHSDCTSCVVSAKNLADTLERAGRSWKAYAENLPHAGFTGPYSGRYAKKHMPFLYFRDVLSRRARLRRVVPLAQLSRDLAPRGRLPSFSLVVPNLCHDMHDCPVSTGDAWLHRFLPRLLKSPKLAHGVVFVVTDETEGAAAGKVPALALGPLVAPGSKFSGRTSHYGLLRTIEDAWGLPRLGHSAGTTAITGIWR